MNYQSSYYRKLTHHAAKAAAVTASNVTDADIIRVNCIYKHRIKHATKQIASSTLYSKQKTKIKLNTVPQTQHSQPVSNKVSASGFSHNKCTR